jgi:coenzyme F420-0:L-glutamate ligase/coenzyme F420-1:gamma-L-glutamate ligase
MTSTDLHDFLRSRRSVRRFKPDPVPASTIERILETTTYAPSAHNLQPWRFVVATTSPAPHTGTGAVAKTRLGKALTTKMRADMTIEGLPELEIESRAARSIRRLDEAPVVILLCRDVTAIRKDEREEMIMSIQSVAAAGLQLMLAAHAEGLGANWICWPLYAQEAARATLELPDTWEPQAMFFLGYGEEEPREKTLRLMKEVVQYV